MAEGACHVCSTAHVGLIQALGALMTVFADWKEELKATQAAAEELMRQIASGPEAPDQQALQRLERLATTCARLAFGAGEPSILSQPVYNLVNWCDHLDDPHWRSEFIVALRSYPLGAPWQRT
jgi:hypothetical protein